MKLISQNREDNGYPWMQRLFWGRKNPDSPCAQKDDMDKIYPVYREADIVVLATPLYYWTISGQLKRLLTVCLR